MDSGFFGPEIKPLPETVEYDATEISDYITTVLQQLKQEGAYGIFVGISDNTGQVVPATGQVFPTFIFGVPQIDATARDIVLPQPPHNTHTWVKEDRFMLIPGSGDLFRWATTPISNPGRIALDAISVGIEGSLEGAGSFGGYLKKESLPGKIFGITAANCMPKASTGMAVCSPSTIEVTSQFNRLLRYTTICPPTPGGNRLHITQIKQTEVESMLQQFRFHEHPEGTTFLDPADSDKEKKGVLSGQQLGEIISYDFARYEGLLHLYDQKLQKHGLRHFFSGRNWETRLDWCLFSCDMNRYAGNVYEGETVSEIGYLYPGADVEKIGRSSGIKCGKVNPVMLQHWQGGQITFGIAIIGECGWFAEAGDSGGCVLVNENGWYKAAGILTGEAAHGGIAVATPLALILDFAADYVWA